MTRINVVEASELENMHLMAEYRELPRVFKLATQFKSSNKKEDFPLEYTLGKGHVKFFYNKLLWLFNRQKSLIEELIKRGYRISFTTPEELIKDVPKEYLNDYVVTDSALKINRERISERIKSHAEKIASKKGVEDVP